VPLLLAPLQAEPMAPLLTPLRVTPLAPLPAPLQALPPAPALEQELAQQLRA
jgi:hypothetical protein